ncbi:MAG: hypothetical protein FWG18_01045, partial [Alphaproteobacteria bacterium]|nr:hypothetical protein [Alphaproteobacteria bacterium]
MAKENILEKVKNKAEELRKVAASPREHFKAKKKQHIEDYRAFGKIGDYALMTSEQFEKRWNYDKKLLEKELGIKFDDPNIEDKYKQEYLAKMAVRKDIRRAELSAAGRAAALQFLMWIGGDNAFVKNLKQYYKKSHKFPTFSAYADYYLLWLLALTLGFGGAR